MGARVYRGNTPQALAILHHALLNVLRGRGWKRIADALRQYGAAVERALWFIGALPPDFDFTLGSRRKGWSRHVHCETEYIPTGVVGFSLVARKGVMP